MTLKQGSAVSPASRGPSVRQLAGLRRASLASLVLLVVQYGVGIAVNLYVTVPRPTTGKESGRLSQPGQPG